MKHQSNFTLPRSWPDVSYLVKNPPPPPQNISFEFSSPPDYLSSFLHSSQNSITTIYTDDVDFLLFYAARRSLLLFLSRSRCKNKTVCRPASSRCRSNLLLLHLSLLNDAMHTLRRVLLLMRVRRRRQRRRNSFTFARRHSPSVLAHRHVSIHAFHRDHVDVHTFYVALLAGDVVNGERDKNNCYMYTHLAELPRRKVFLLPCREACWLYLKPLASYAAAACIERGGRTDGRRRRMREKRVELLE